MVINMNIKKILEKAFVKYDSNLNNHFVDGIKDDSRNVEENDVFFAIKGGQTDGKLYIDEKYGEYEVEKYEAATNLVFDDGKKIQIGDLSTTVEKSESSKEKLLFPCAEYPILTFCVEKGLENMGFDTSISPGYDSSIYYTLITRGTPYPEFFCTLDEYYDACAYYALYMTIMPCGNRGSYYIVSETNEDLIVWGMSMIGEEANTYLMHFQHKGEYGKETMLLTNGFTKEEAQEIFKYAVIK